MDIMDYAAIYAAIIATSALIWNILREKRKVKVKLEFNWMLTDLSGKTGEIVQVGFTVINDSRYPAYIEEVGIIFSDGDEYSWHHSTFVVDRCVHPGLSTTIWKNVKDIKQYSKGKTSKFGFIKDATFRCYRKRIPKAVANELKN